MDYNFTARLEEILDLVANSSTDRLRVLEGFFYGDPTRDFPGLDPLVKGLGDIDARAMASFPIGPDGLSEGLVTGAPGEIVLRVGKYGPYVERGEEKGNVGEDVAPDELDLAMAEALLAAPSGDRVLGRASRVRAGDRGQVRPVRAVRDRGAARGRTEVGQAADRLAAERDVAGHPRRSTTRCGS